VRGQRRLALGVLLAAVGLAAAAYPFRATWWGGWILAVAEAGIVGGLADWFAVTAIFRRPLGLPIPHTALIQANWELLAARVGSMVGDRVLTRQYLTYEIERLDLADWLARGAERVSRRELESATRAGLSWIVRQMPVASAGELTARLAALLASQPVAPTLADALEAARQHGWDQRAAAAIARGVADALDRRELRGAVGDLVEELLVHYRARMGTYPRLALGLAGILGLLDREKIVGALQAGLREMALDPEHPLRARASAAVADLAGRLRGDPALVARVEALKHELLESPAVSRLVEDAVRTLRETLREDLQRPRSEAVGWLVDRLERWRRALVADAALRGQLDQWVKRQALQLVERQHGQIAIFIEKGVHALGPEGAVRLIEEHAGDDLQYIRVNGTVVGGLAGGLLYALHLLLRLL
jgi:uncharacterized membrane-anchored protein YjiN (DUF445 family)